VDRLYRWFCPQARITSFILGQLGRDTPTNRGRDRQNVGGQNEAPRF
jgi:hypothetical protein